MRDQIIAVTDRLGDATSFTHHPETGKPASITNARGDTVSFTYAPQEQTFTNPANGETVTFTLFATNTGDVREDGILIRSGEQLAPIGWVVVASAATLSLDPKETGTFTVAVTVPMDTALAPANLLAHIGVTIQSSADSTVFSAKEIMVQVKSNFLIQMAPDFERQYANPGETVVYRISISNIGNLAGQAQIHVESQQPSQVGWVAALDVETIYLRGGETTEVALRVSVPQNAIAASRLTLVVSALAVKFGTSGQTEVTTFVNRVYGLNFDVGSSPDVRVGRTATFPLTVSNTGNGDETLTLAPGLLEVGWSMDFSQNSVAVQSIFVPHGESRTVDVRVTTDAHAAAGLHTPVAAVIAAVGAFPPQAFRHTAAAQASVTAKRGRCGEALTSPPRDGTGRIRRRSSTNWMQSSESTGRPKPGECRD